MLLENVPAFFPVTLPSVSTSGPTPSLDMRNPHTIMGGSPVLTVPSVQVGIHSSVDLLFQHYHLFLFSIHL